jgi:putative hemolysin
MAPRVDVAYLEVELTVEEATARARSAGFTRYPVVDNRNLDKVIGYVNVKDFALAEKPPSSLRDVLRDVLVVPETMAVFHLMRDMQRRQTPLAIVVDEYGGTSGIATLEDVLEEIVGEIRDEHDEEAPRVQTNPDGSVSTDGLATLNDLRGAGIELPEGESDTIGGLVLAALGRLARSGDQVTIGGFEAKVETVRRRRVARVTLKRLPERAAETEEAEPPRRSSRPRSDEEK